MIQNSFVTETDIKHVQRQTNRVFVIIFAIASVFACLGFLIAWQTFLFFEAAVLISCAVALFSNRKSSHSWKLKFENDRLYITNQTTGDVFEVYDIPASDFVINQTKEEQEIDYCSLLVKNTVFAFGGVKNCRDLKNYIANNFD